MYGRINQINYNINPQKEELLEFIANSYWNCLRGILTDEDNLYVLDSEAALHNEMRRNLGISGVGFFVENDNFDVNCDEDRLKLLSSFRISEFGLNIKVLNETSLSSN